MTTRQFTISSLIIIWIILTVVGIIIPANAQVASEPSDLYLRLADDGGYHMVCIQGCDYYNALGTTEELNRRFTEYHCAINWSHALRNRRRDAFSQLGYLPGPNGDLSNPLCGA